MSMEKDAFNAVYTVLSTNATLSGYIKTWYKGLTKNVSPEMMPSITLEPRRTPEERHTIQNTFTYHNKMKLNIDVIGEIYVANTEYQIIGKAAVTGPPAVAAIIGIFDLACDIKNALDANPSLSGKCQKVNFVDTVYDSYDVGSWPFRSVIISLEIELISSTGR